MHASKKMPGVKSQTFCHIHLPSQRMALVTGAPGHSNLKQPRAFKEEKNLPVVRGFVMSLWTL